MYGLLSTTITEIVRFTNEHRIDANFHIHTAGDLQGHNGLPDEYWAKFEKFAGVYVFFSADGKQVRYVGMSEKDTGGRLFQWLYTQNKVNDSLTSNDLVLSIVLKQQPYMSPALESFLIAKLNPQLNKINNRSLAVDEMS